MSERFFWTMPIDVRWRDLDGLGHVNNAVYLTYFETARCAYALELLGGTRLEDITFILGESTIRYLKPAHFGDDLVIGARVERIGTKSFVLAYELRREGEVICAGSSIQVWYDYAADRSIPVPDSFRQRVAAVQGEPEFIQR